MDNHTLDVDETSNDNFDVADDDHNTSPNDDHAINWRDGCDTSSTNNDGATEEVEEEANTDWDLTPMSTEESEQANKLSYIEDLHAKSDLLLLQPLKVAHAYEKQGILGLFYLFLPLSFLNGIRAWTNENIRNEGSDRPGLKGVVDQKTFNAYQSKTIEG